MTKEQKERLLEETQQTAGRLNELNKFMASDIFPSLDREDKDLLYEQSRTMNRLVQILGQRLERAGKVFEHACCNESGSDACCEEQGSEDCYCSSKSITG